MELSEVERSDVVMAVDLGGLALAKVGFRVLRVKRDLKRGVEKKRRCWVIGTLDGRGLVKVRREKEGKVIVAMAAVFRRIVEGNSCWSRVYR